MHKKTLPGVRLQHHKHTAGAAPERLPIPAVVTIPLSMHIGAPAQAVVAVGDVVKVGQRIAEAGGFVSAPVHTGVSGKVKKIEDVLMPDGRFVPAIVIETDGLQTVSEEVIPPEIASPEDFLAAVRASGVVGLGGAGFPTAVKLTVKDLSKIEAVIVNGAECEPYITSDTRTMLDDTELVLKGVALLQKYLQVKRVIIAIEDNKHACIAAFKKTHAPGIEVRALPAVYPQGGEKVLVYHTLGRTVPEGGLPIDVGAIVVNVTTLAALARYIKTGMPLVEKCVTVDGSAVKTPKNVIAPIGTPIETLLTFCGGFKAEPKKLLYGGPMMGLALSGLDAPVLKNTNAVLAFDGRDAVLPEETACIKCGRCAARCPFQLSPLDIETAYRLKKPEELAELKLKLCMECGCCAYVCPAKRPLVQVNKLAKVMLRDWEAAQKAASDMVNKKEEKK